MSGSTYTYCIQRDEEPLVDNDEKIRESRGWQQKNRKGVPEINVKKKEN